MVQGNETGPAEEGNWSGVWQHKYFDPSPASFMMNYIVDDFEALLERLGKEGIRIDSKIELWQPLK